MKFSVRYNHVGYAPKEEDRPRMVRTPWFEEEIPLAQAAEVGTRKVICEHSTIGIVYRKIKTNLTAISKLY